MTGPYHLQAIKKGKTMANVDFFTVTCDNKDVLDAIKGGEIYAYTV